MNWADMTDEAIKEAATKIADTSYTDDEVRRRIGEELQYPYADSISLHSSESEPNAVGQRMRMTMGMMWSPRGNVIGF